MPNLNKLKLKKHTLKLKRIILMITFDRYLKKIIIHEILTFELVAQMSRNIILG